MAGSPKGERGPIRSSRLATSKSHSEVPRAFEIFPLNELQVVADSSVAAAAAAVENDEDEDGERRETAVDIDGIS